MSVRTNRRTPARATKPGQGPLLHRTATLAAILLLAGPPTHADEVRKRPLKTNEYRYEIVQHHVNRRSPDTFIAATFSGGGMRAASLAYGALTALRDTTIDPSTDASRVAEPRPSPLIADVDFVSSASGGSVTAAYWALHGTADEFDRFPEKFLKAKAQHKMIANMFDPPSLAKMFFSSFSRTNVLSEYFSRELLGTATYRDLLDRTFRSEDRPYLVINATDMGTRSVFPLVQLQFDLICADLGEVKLADAVAATSAYPLAFTALTFPNNQAGGSDCRLPDHYQEIEDLVERNRNVVDELREEWLVSKSAVNELKRKVQATTKRYQNQENELKKASQKMEALDDQLDSARKDALRQESELAQSNALLAIATGKHELASKVEHIARKRLANTEEDFNERISDLDSRRSELVETRRQTELGLSETRAATTRAGQEYGSTLDKVIDKIRAQFGAIPDYFKRLKSLLGGKDEPVDAFSKTLREFDEWVEEVRRSLDLSEARGDEEGASHSASVTKPIDKQTAPEQLESSSRELAGLDEELEELGSDFDAADRALRELDYGLADADSSAMRRVTSFVASIIPRVRSFNKRIEILRAEEDEIRLEMDELERSTGGDGSLAPEPGTSSVPMDNDHVDESAGETATGENGSDAPELSTGSASSGDGDGVETPGVTGTHLVATTQKEPDAKWELVSDRVATFARDVHGLRENADELNQIHARVGNYQMALKFYYDNHKRDEKVTALEDQLVQTRKDIGDATRQLDALRRERNAELKSRRLEVQGLAEETKNALAQKEQEHVQSVSLEARKTESERQLHAKTQELANAAEARKVKVELLDLLNDVLVEQLRQRELAANEERRRNAELARFRTVQLEHSIAVDNYRKQRAYYSDAENQFVHLMDGGAADNLGFSPLVELLDSFFPSDGLSGQQNGEWKSRTKHIAVIMVDARGTPKRNVASFRKPPNVLHTILTTVDTAIEGKSFMLAKELERITRKLEVDRVVDNQFVVKVDFDAIAWETDTDDASRCKAEYQKIPTNWNLGPEVADAVIELGRALVLNSPEYVELVEKLDGELPEAESVAMVCSRHLDALREYHEKRERKARRTDTSDNNPS